METLSKFYPHCLNPASLTKINQHYVSTFSYLAFKSLLLAIRSGLRCSFYCSFVESRKSSRFDSVCLVVFLHWFCCRLWQVLHWWVSSMWKVLHWYVSNIWQAQHWYVSSVWQVLYWWVSSMWQALYWSAAISGGNCWKGFLHGLRILYTPDAVSIKSIPISDSLLL